MCKIILHSYDSSICIDEIEIKKLLTFTNYHKRASTFSDTRTFEIKISHFSIRKKNYALGIKASQAQLH